MNTMQVEWTILNEQAQTEWETKDLKAQREALNAEIRAVLQERERIDGILGRLQTTPIENLTVEDMTAARSAKEARFELIRTELKLRKGALSDYQDANREALRQAVNKQELAVQQLNQQIQEQLESIGYLNPEGKGPEQLRGTWGLEMVARHPKRRDAADLLDKWERLSIAPDRTNTDATGELQRHMQAIAQQLMSVSL